ncbi:ArnT family glycosyltransferase [Vampirovibrio chlorellavorus]|uniref:ArnT family glycosyltransferase n=1 Tax=Vampirovibrio chlorellavorus TaxID=758823 RepID=UPI0026EA2051|nr:hypothetical protein [Vampirovibrio chlorellavorus]
MFLKQCDLKIAGLWLGLLTGFVMLAFHLMRPDVVGFLYDDGMYLMVAKAMAEGHGYRLMGIVDQPYFYKYPPLFPLMLTLGWLINPQFPHNIVWLKSINILLATGTLALWGYYFRTIRQFPQWVCVLLIFILGTHWRFLEVSIDLMSEPLFMLISTLALILCHRFNRDDQPFTAAQVAMLVLLSVAAFYTRTMALPLIVAIGLWLWLSGQRKQTGAYWLGSGLLMLPWLLWSGSRKDTTYALGDFLVRTFQETYFQSFRMDLKYEYTLPALVGKGIQELLGNFSVQFFPLLERFFLQKPTLLSESVILGLSFALILLLGRYAYQRLKARQFSPEGLYVSVYLAILPFWSFYNVYPRFLMPLLPILWALLWCALLPRGTQSSPKPWFLPGLLMVAILVLNNIHLQPYLYKQSANQMAINTQIDVWQEYADTLHFLNTQVPPHSRIYLENLDEAYFYALNTTHQALDAFLFLPMNKLEQHCPQSQRACLESLYSANNQAKQTLINQKNITYLVSSTVQITKLPKNNWRLSAKKYPLAIELKRSNSPRFLRVFQSPHGLIEIFKIQHAQKDR